MMISPIMSPIAHAAEIPEEVQVEGELQGAEPESSEEPEPSVEPAITVPEPSDTNIPPADGNAENENLESANASDVIPQAPEFFEMPEMASSASAIEISIEPTLKIVMGTTSTLLVEFSPVGTQLDDLVWDSSDSAVAAVDQNGAVTAIAVGYAGITVHSASDPSISASCSVYVSARAYGLQGVSSGRNQIALRQPGTTTTRTDVQVQQVGVPSQDVPFRPGISVQVPYINRILTPFDATLPVDFYFTMTSGMNQFQNNESMFRNSNGMPHIKIYNSTRTTLIAEYDGGNGDLKFRLTTNSV